MEWKSLGVMDDESGDDDRDELTSEWRKLDKWIMNVFKWNRLTHASLWAQRGTAQRMCVWMHLKFRGANV